MPRKKAGRGAAANANGGKTGGRNKGRGASQTSRDEVLDSSDEEVQVTRVMEGGVEEGAAQALTNCRVATHQPGGKSVSKTCPRLWGH